MSGRESTGGHPRGISRRAFVHRQKAQADSRSTYVTEADARRLLLDPCVRKQTVKISTAPLNLPTVERGHQI